MTDQDSQDTLATLSQYRDYVQQAPADQVAAAHSAALRDLSPDQQQSVLGRFRDEVAQSGHSFLQGSTGTGPDNGGQPGGIGHFFDSFLHGSTGTGGESHNPVGNIFDSFLHGSTGTGGESHNPLGNVFSSFLHGSTDTHWHDKAGQAMGSTATQAAQADPGILGRIFGGGNQDATSNEFMGRVLDHGSRMNDEQV